MSCGDCSQTKAGHNIAFEIVVILLTIFGLSFAIYRGMWSWGMLAFVALFACGCLGIFALLEAKYYRWCYGTATVAIVLLVWFVYSLIIVVGNPIQTREEIQEAVQLLVDKETGLSENQKEDLVNDGTSMAVTILFVELACGISVTLVLAIRHIVIARKTEKMLDSLLTLIRITVPYLRMGPSPSTVGDSTHSQPDPPPAYSDIDRANVV